MAKTYKEQTGVNIEPVFTSDVVGTHLAERYASGNPYTIMMVDRPDVYDSNDWSLAKHYFGQLYNQQGNSAEGSQAFVDSLEGQRIFLLSGWAVFQGTALAGSLCVLE